MKETRLGSLGDEGGLTSVKWLEKIWIFDQGQMKGRTVRSAQISVRRYRKSERRIEKVFLPVAVYARKSGTFLRV